MSTGTDQQYKKVEEAEFDLKLFINALKNKFYLLVVIIATGLVLAGAYIFLAPPVYKASFSALSPVVNNYHAEKLVNTIQKILEDKNFKAAEEKLDLSSDQVKQVQTLQFKFNQEDQRYFTIEAFVYHPEAFRILVDAVEHYFQNNPYNARIVQLEKEQLQEQIANAEEQLQSLDSVKNNLQHFTSQRGKQPNSVFVYPSNVHLEEVKILEKKGQYKEQLKKLSPITIYETPLIPKEPTYPKTLLVLGIAFLFSVFVGLIVVIFLAYIDQYKKQLSN